MRLRSVTGKSLPVSSRLSDRSSAKNATVAGPSKRRSTLRIAAGVEPANADASTAWCVTLQRPPPATRIFAPRLRAGSHEDHEDGPPRRAAVRRLDRRHQARGARADDEDLGHAPASSGSACTATRWSSGIASRRARSRRSVASCASESGVLAGKKQWQDRYSPGR